MITFNLSELDFAKMELDNLIEGKETTKAIYKHEGYPWEDEDERELNLLKLIKGILERIVVKKDEIPN